MAYFRDPRAGRTYGGTTIAVDRGNLDASELFHAGWVTLADHTGPTSAGPLVDEYNHPIALGLPLFRYDARQDRRPRLYWVDRRHDRLTELKKKMR